MIGGCPGADRGGARAGTAPGSRAHCPPDRPGSRLRSQRTKRRATWSSRGYIGLLRCRSRASRRPQPPDAGSRRQADMRASARLAPWRPSIGQPPTTTVEVRSWDPRTEMRLVRDREGAGGPFSWVGPPPGAARRSSDPAIRCSRCGHALSPVSVDNSPEASFPQGAQREPCLTTAQQSMPSVKHRGVKERCSHAAFTASDPINPSPYTRARRKRTAATVQVPTENTNRGIRRPQKPARPVTTKGSCGHEDNHKHRGGR